MTQCYNLFLRLRKVQQEEKEGECQSLSCLSILHSLCACTPPSTLLHCTEVSEDPMSSMLAQIRSGNVQLKKVASVSLALSHTCAVLYGVASHLLT